MSRSRPTSSRDHPRVDPVLVLVLACLVGLIVILRTDLEAGATALVLAGAGIVGAAAGAVTRPHDHRHGLLLSAVLIVPTIALGRWTAAPYGVIWLVAAGAGAIAGRSHGLDGRDTGRSRPSGPTHLSRTDEGQQARAGRDLPWMLLILAGLLLPLGAGLAAVAWQAPSALRFAVVLAALVATDAPLVAAGMRGEGADGIVQPWRWPAYLGWLAIRLVLLLALLGPWDG
jgi:hypothetical protein